LKDWPIPYWQKLMDLVLREFPDLKIVVYTKDNERFTKFKLSKRVIQFNYEAGPEESDFLTSLCVISEAEFVVSLDSGIAHMSGFSKTPCVALFGPTIPMVWGNPNNFNLRVSLCPPCNNQADRSSQCQRNACMEAIKPDQVLESIRSVLR
jgi:ADP-heptose:LPS heptosyltransferase